MLSFHVSALIAWFQGRQFLTWRSRIVRFARSPLSTNSLFLVGGTIASALLGFVYWAIAARLTSPAEVGIATAAIASTSLLITLCDLGIGTSIIYFAARKPESATTLINTSVSLGWLLSGGAGLIFLLGVPFFAAGLEPIRTNLWLAILFLLFTIMNYLLTLHDAMMLTQRRGVVIFARNILCNLPSVFLIAPLALAGIPMAPFIAFCLPNIFVAILFSLLLLPRVVHGYRFFGRIDRLQLAQMTSFSLATHLANLVWGSTTFLLPIIAINYLTPEQTGYFFINWTLANFVLIVPRSVISALFVEGAHQQKLAPLVLRASMLIVGLALPPLLFIWFWNGLLLGIFGQDYVDEPLLRLLLLTIVPFVINSIVFMILRLQAKLRLALLYAIVVSGSVVLIAVLLAPLYWGYGLAWAWLIGQSIGACSALVLYGGRIFARRSRSL